jgi:hypothetical protein
MVETPKLTNLMENGAMATSTQLQKVAARISVRAHECGCGLAGDKR